MRRNDREKRTKRASGQQDKSWENTQGVLPGVSNRDRILSQFCDRCEFTL